MLQNEVVINHEQLREAFNADRKQMTLMVARKMRVPEVEVIRSLEGDIAHELDSSRWEEIICSFEEFGNVQSKSLDMHIRSWLPCSLSASPAIPMGARP